MIIQQFFHKYADAGDYKKVAKDTQIKSADVFQAILAKEQARVDRNYHVFSLVTFTSEPDDPDIGIFYSFILHLKNNIRITDEIGWLDDHSIGILLFNNLEEEAKLFVRKIDRDRFQKFISSCSISTYPENLKTHPHSSPISCGLTDSCDQSPLLSETVDDQLAGEPAGPVANELEPVFFKKMPVGKRLFDIVVSSLALVVLSPIMLAIAVAIKRGSPGPILFKQQRAGLGGVPFTFLKFRTMYVDAESRKSELLPFNQRTGPVFKMEDDPRTTPLGRHLRKWSLDELPQFWNVLKGDMSLVGPRPPTLDEVEQYDCWHGYRLEVKPGITCIWQVYARHEKSFENWVRLDIKYKREQSFLLDLKLMALTLPAVLSRRGAS